MHFVSTRGEEKVNAPQAVLRGCASGGGLFVPETFPPVSEGELADMLPLDYAERAAYLLGKYFDEYDMEGLASALRNAYSKFEGGDAAPLVRMDNGMYMLELFHGPTCAFKDLSVGVLPYLISEGKKLCGVREELLLVSATGGDTAKATLENFAGAEGIRAIVFYPEDGVSKMQKLQLCTQDGENVEVIAVRGSFDDCQSALKKMFRLEKYRTAIAEKGYLLTTSDSVNIARILLETCYYFSAYLDLVSAEQIGMGDKVDFCVPTGNFGNILAGYYAKRMGLPIGTLLCATNRNSPLSDFFRTGCMDTKRPLCRTMSPSMDVVSASNVERLIFEVSGRDAQLTKERMKELSSTGRYTLRAEEIAELRRNFYADATSEDDTVECIYEFFEDYGYPMDTHTGVAMNVAQKYLEKLESDTMSESHPMVIVSTASPYKFPQDVLYALTGNDVKDSFKGVKRIHLLTAMKVPEALKAVRYKPIRFKTAVSPEKMFDALLKFLD